MMRSLFSGVSGLRVHQTRMDVIGHNIANVNTVGFKAGRMTFADAMSQRIAGATGDNPDRGRAGTNPMQIGLGVNVGGIDSMMQQGAAQRTDRATDITIQGEGFFIVSDVNGTYFTRAGNIDWNGNNFSIGGRMLMGWGAVEDARRPGSFVIQQGQVQPLLTPPETHFMDPTQTTMVDVIGNLNVNNLVDGSIVRQVQFYDSLGNLYTADARFTWHPPANHPDADPDSNVFSDNTRSIWDFELLPGGAGSTAGNTAVTLFPGGNRDHPISVDLQFGWPPDLVDGDTARGHGGRISFCPNRGRINGFTLLTDTPGEPGVIERPEFGLFFSVPALAPPSVVGEDAVVDTPPEFNTGMIRFNFADIRQQMGMQTTLRLDYVDGNTAGTLQDISIGGDGIITARYSNGEMRPLGQIALAEFLNPEGLERRGDNLWIPTANSGTFDGVGFTGDLMAGTLEMSNVQLAEEFTGMITTQRGMQANSRVITTSDEILQELINLKR